MRNVITRILKRGAPLMVGELIVVKIAGQYGQWECKVEKDRIPLNAWDINLEI